MHTGGTIAGFNSGDILIYRLATFITQYFYNAFYGGITAGWTGHDNIIADPPTVSATCTSFIDRLNR